MKTILNMNVEEQFSQDVQKIESNDPSITEIEIIQIYFDDYYEYSENKYKNIVDFYQALINALKVNSTIHTLIFKSEVYPYAFKFFIEMLKSNQTIKKLEILTDNEGYVIKMLADFLAFNCSIEKVIISNNYINSESMGALVKMLQCNRSLTTLDISYSETRPEYQTIKSLLDYNQHERKITQKAKNCQGLFYGTQTLKKEEIAEHVYYLETECKFIHRDRNKIIKLQALKHLLSSFEFQITSEKESIEDMQLRFPDAFKGPANDPTNRLLCRIKSMAQNIKSEHKNTDMHLG